jgi:hypothetical protein
MLISSPHHCFWNFLWLTNTLSCQRYILNLPGNFVVSNFCHSHYQQTFRLQLSRSPILEVLSTSGPKKCTKHHTTWQLMFSQSTWNGDQLGKGWSKQDVMKTGDHPRRDTLNTLNLILWTLLMNCRAYCFFSVPFIEKKEIIIWKVCRALH